MPEEISRAGLKTGYHLIIFYYDKETLYYHFEIVTIHGNIIDKSKGFFELEDCSGLAHKNYGYEPEF